MTTRTPSYRALRLHATAGDSSRAPSPLLTPATPPRARTAAFMLLLSRLCASASSRTSPYSSNQHASRTLRMLRAYTPAALALRTPRVRPHTWQRRLASRNALVHFAPLLTFLHCLAACHASLPTNITCLIAPLTLPTLIRDEGGPSRTSNSRLFPTTTTAPHAPPTHAPPAACALRAAPPRCTRRAAQAPPPPRTASHRCLALYLTAPACRPLPACLLHRLDRCLLPPRLPTALLSCLLCTHCTPHTAFPPASSCCDMT